MNLIVTPGLFSAWARGVTIDPDAYIAFIKSNEKYLFAYASLDTIPGGSVKRQHISEDEGADCARNSTRRTNV